MRTICHRPLYSQRTQSAGFTLIEVMVAAVILFSVIATVSMIYRGAFLSSEKANNYVVISGVLPSILATIKDDIQSRKNISLNTISNKGNAWAINYQWQATLQEQSTPPKKFDPFTKKLTIPNINYKLWTVSLKLEYKGVNKEYVFNEFSWITK